MFKILVCCVLLLAVSAEAITFQAVDDTYTNAAFPTTPYGSGDTIRIRLGGTNPKYGYFKFNVTGTGGDVQTATLRLRTTGSNVPQDTGIYTVTGNWSEGTLTWDNDTLVWGALLDSSNVNDTSTWYEFDVTSGITGDGTYTFGVIPITTGWMGRWSTKESAFVPELVIMGAPEKASSPDPQDGSNEIELDTKLSFSPGSESTKHDIYLGTDFNDVNDAITPLARIDVITFDPCGLMPDVTYYWRVDEVNDISNPELVWKGDIWSFTTRERAGANSPSPKDGDDDVAANISLSWTPGDFADFHDVYFGTDFDEINDANIPLARIDTNTFDPGGLLLDTRYYWRIDEVSGETGQWPGVYRGPIWSFATLDHIVVDDFDFYVDSVTLSLTWIDGAGNTSGATVSLEEEFHGDSMRFEYDNGLSPWYSQSSRLYLASQDWTASSVKALQLMFKGSAGNSAGPMYLALEDGLGARSVVFYADANDLQQARWQVWNIDLSDFAADGVGLTGVREIAVGFGDPDSPQAGGTGTVYFDDIRLYRQRCFSRYGPSGDFTGDCTADEADLDVIMRHWLFSDYTVSAESPDDGRLLAHYRFDETSGSSAYDSSGNGFTSLVRAVTDSNEFPVDTGWDASGYDGGCLDFDGTFGVLIPDEVFADVNEVVTISVWLNAGDDGGWGDVSRIEFATGRPQNRIDPADANDFVWNPNQWNRAKWTPNDTGDYQGQWNHYCFVRDATAGYVRVYHNGLLIAQDEGVLSPIGGSSAGPTEIGGWGQYGHYIGRLDEFKVYDYALSQAQVLHLAAGGGQLYQPLTPVVSPIDPYVDGVLNIIDLAIVAGDWLDEQLWPQ